MKYKVTVKNTGSGMKLRLKIKYHGKSFKYSVKGDTLNDITEYADPIEKEIQDAFGKDAKKIIKRITRDFN